jgi:hypothetical protein
MGNLPLRHWPHPRTTEVLAYAYGELLAYAELLGQNGSARPDMIRQDTVTVEEIKSQLADAWLQLSQEEREQTQTLPAVWSILRRALSHGGESHRESAQNIIPNRHLKPDVSHPGILNPLEWLWLDTNQCYRSNNNFQPLYVVYGLPQDYLRVLRAAYRRRKTLASPLRPLLKKTT